MILTDNCLQGFEKWMGETQKCTIIKPLIIMGNEFKMSRFGDLPDFVQYAYFDRFFEESGIWITRVPQQFTDGSLYWEYGIYTTFSEVSLIEYVGFDSRELVLEHANEIYNNSKQ